MQGKSSPRRHKDTKNNMKRVTVRPEEDWRAIQETIYLTSIPGMRESIRKGLKTPVEECDEEPGW